MTERFPLCSNFPSLLGLWLLRCAFLQPTLDLKRAEEEGRREESWKNPRTARARERRLSRWPAAPFWSLASSIHDLASIGNICSVQTWFNAKNISMSTTATKPRARAMSRPEGCAAGKKRDKKERAGYHRIKGSEGIPHEGYKPKIKGLGAEAHSPTARLFSSYGSRYNKYVL